MFSILYAVVGSQPFGAPWVSLWDCCLGMGFPAGGSGQFQKVVTGGLRVPMHCEHSWSPLATVGDRASGLQAVGPGNQHRGIAA